MSERQYRIGQLILQPHRQLLAGEQPIALGRKALELLTILAEANGDLVTKDEIMMAVWPDTTIEENSLQAHIAALRKALGEYADRLITVRGLGYRLVRDRVTVSSPPDDSHEATIAVLAFVNLTGETDLDYLGDGIAEELIARLSQVSELKVAARTSCFAYKEHMDDVRQIAHELGVAAIVEGSVRKAGESIRITAQLIDAGSGFHRWSENFNHSINDPLAMQDEVADRIVNSIKPYLV